MTNHPHSPARRAIVAVLAITTAIAACSLPTDERAIPDNVDDLPPLLTETTSTTSTTTTTTTTTTTVPTTALPGESTTTSTTTTLPIQTAPVTVYYTLGSTDQMQPLVIEQPTDIGTPTIIGLLESPVGLIQLNLRSSVRTGLIDDVTVERGVATVTLDTTVLDRMSEPERRRAVAQMVLTFTSFSTADQGNIGFVQFEADGDHYEVFVPAFGSSSRDGDLLAFSDFAELITTSAPTTTTLARAPITSATTTTSTTSTTVVAGSTPPTSDA